jgi:hypothetical protein
MLAVAVFALYGKHLLGIWRSIYVVTAMLSLDLNVFVLIVQSFLKIAPLKALAPTHGVADRAERGIVAFCRSSRQQGSAQHNFVAPDLATKTPLAEVSFASKVGSRELHYEAKHRC